MTHGLSGQNPLHWPVDCANSGCGKCGIKVRSCSSEARRLLYGNTLKGCRIGHISWAVDLKENRFRSVATGSISGFLRLFWDAQGSVAAEGRLSNGKPVASKFQLKLLAGKWSDEIGIAFAGNRAKESVLPAAATLQSADLHRSWKFDQ
jgi:hypothetical protein